MKEHDSVIYIMRKDFRIHDNPALYEASKHKNTYILYIYDPMREKIGSAKKWWLHHALVDIKQKLRKLNGKLIIKKGCFEEEIKSLLRETEAVQFLFGNEPLEVLETVARDGIDVRKEKTLGGKIWWREVERKNGYILQQNILSQHFRILDDEFYRIFSSLDEHSAQERFKELV